MAGTRIENGGLQNTSSGYTVGAEGLQAYKRKLGRPRKVSECVDFYIPHFKDKAKEKLDGHHQTRFEGHGHHLGRS